MAEQRRKDLAARPGSLEVAPHVDQTGFPSKKIVIYLDPGKSGGVADVTLAFGSEQLRALSNALRPGNKNVLIHADGKVVTL